MSERERLQKGIESWDDVRNRFNDILKRPIDWFLWHRDILPRYVDGRLSVHMHFAATKGGAYCAEVCPDPGGVGRDLGASGLNADAARPDQTNSEIPDMTDGQQR